MRRGSEGAEPEPETERKTRRAPTQMFALTDGRLPTAGPKDRETGRHVAQARGVAPPETGQSGGAKFPNNASELESLR